MTATHHTAASVLVETPKTASVVAPAPPTEPSVGAISLTRQASSRSLSIPTQIRAVEERKAAEIVAVSDAAAII